MESDLGDCIDRPSTLVSKVDDVAENEGVGRGGSGRWEELDEEYCESAAESRFAE